MTRTYTGTRLPDGTTSVVVTAGEWDGTRTYDLPHHTRHSPDGFNWGYGGSGSAELARCILIDYLGALKEDAAPGQLSLVEGAYQDFKAEVVVSLNSDTFELTGNAIYEWLRNHR